MKRTLKFFHTLGAIGVMGALAAHIILLTVIPGPESLSEYALMRQAIAAIAKWMLLPALAMVLLSGLLSMAVHRPFQGAGWAWLKLATGVIMFEGTLLTVQGPAQKAAELSSRALAGEIDPATLLDSAGGEWGSLWVILVVALTNVALAIWRPRLTRRHPPGD